ncbi:hypothetical protein EXU85_13460 [Spirosoma sp. KCTC 42546]|uniref:transposase n=1 Tax=Spirosoma sp. KCTC 42546 TaxID=2520506 RepID=UPI001158FD07|nr:transposase [Spirosoma sp. KCTC 42546]QDK79555.1 hypothetical protein EXU85_13460 [Spirosoma sp. KCTC 42546]
MFFHDELRTGTRTELGTKWTPMGHRPVAPVKIGYESVWLYLTSCPLTGEGFAAFLPRLDGEQFQWFIEQVQTCLISKALFIADGATAHKAEFFAKDKLRFIRLPTACPELNPVERFFKEVRRQLKSRVFTTLEQAQQCVQEAVELLADKVVSITAFPYIRDASNQY